MPFKKTKRLFRMSYNSDLTHNKTFLAKIPSFQKGPKIQMNCHCLNDFFKFLYVDILLLIYYSLKFQTIWFIGS